MPAGRRMQLFSPMSESRNNPPQIDDIFSSYRERIWRLFGIVLVGLFLPGSVFIYLNGHQLLAIAVFFMLTTVALSGFSYARNKAPRMMMALFVASLTLAVGFSIVERGTLGVFWTFPGVLFISFGASGRAARIYTGAFFVCVSSLMLYAVDLEIAVRAVLGLLVTILFTNIFLGIIDKLQKKLVEQSTIDPLTGALNRRGLGSMLEEAVERKGRTGTPASLLVIDVDMFKNVNDTFGHAVGDRVLKEMVSLIQARARRLDKLFRFGGEEFMLFLPDTRASGAAGLAEDLRLLVSQANFIEGHVTTISIGISELERNETIDEWIKRGDDALFLAKKKGRNRAVAGTIAEINVRPMELPSEVYGSLAEM